MKAVTMAGKPAGEGRPCYGIAGLSAAPADAQPQVRAAVKLTLGRPGGTGAVRELLELILAARG